MCSLENKQHFLIRFLLELSTATQTHASICSIYKMMLLVWKFSLLSEHYYSFQAVHLRLDSQQRATGVKKWFLVAPDVCVAYLDNKMDGDTHTAQSDCQNVSSFWKYMGCTFLWLTPNVKYESSQSRNHLSPQQDKTNTKNYWQTHAIWPICDAIHGTMNMSTQVKYKV